jgi:hypothetical protein
LGCRSVSGAEVVRLLRLYSTHRSCKGT